MESLPVPKPPNVTLNNAPVNAGINFQYKLMTGTVYWAMRFVDHNEELREEFAGTLPLRDTKSLLKLGKVVKSFSVDMKLPLRLAGGRTKYSIFDLDEVVGAVAPTFSEVKSLNVVIEESIKNAYLSVEIYTDASWNRSSLIPKVGIGWCALIGTNGTFGNQVYTGIHAKFAERYALIEGLKNSYHDVYKSSGTEGTITLRTDMLYVAEWANKLFTGKKPLSFNELPDNTLFYFMKKCVERTIRCEGPKIIVEWVQGHSGDVWNDYADRIAVLSRRSADVGIRNNKAWMNLTEDFNKSLELLEVKA